MAVTPTGSLTIVGTPIGNLEDITLRALRVLRESDLIAAEDTRHTGILLAHHQMQKPLISYHEFNEAMRTTELIQRLRDGARIALVSDAGMPTVSDPGKRLIRAAIVQGIPVQVIPGVSAVTAAIAIAGCDTERFLFHGFLPHKSSQRRKQLLELARYPFAIVCFDSPYRLLKTLGDMDEILGERRIVIARELTKKFEEILRGTAADLRKRLEHRAIKGEITLIIEPPRS